MSTSPGRSRRCRPPARRRHSRQLPSWPQSAVPGQLARASHHNRARLADTLSLVAARLLPCGSSSRQKLPHASVANFSTSAAAMVSSAGVDDGPQITAIHTGDVYRLVEYPFPAAPPLILPVHDPEAQATHV
ncbi:uncharacterized protein LOC124623019 [Schistocerca americana]|uniref:uncharacterized protein LOC124623019 n=1 Tax=Schistocerca americana TaxID=7009 RepID=UPI001F4FA13D|nr:uncharacterized protein LOC124623019 [Schistocerca americana]